MARQPSGGLHVGVAISVVGKVMKLGRAWQRCGSRVGNFLWCGRRA